MIWVAGYLVVGAVLALWMFVRNVRSDPPKPTEAWIPALVCGFYGLFWPIFVLVIGFATVAAIVAHEATRKGASS